MKTVILAGGFGTRLRSEVADRPKPMGLIAGKPFLQYQLEYLYSFGLTEFILCVGYKADQIMDFFGDGSSFGIQIDYAREEKPLGTAGALKNAGLNEPFLALNGDSFLRVDITQVLTFYQKVHAPVIVCRYVTDASRYGAVQFDAHQRIIAFQEKAKAHGAGWINAGIYVLNPDLMMTIPPHQKVSIEQETFPAYLERGMYAFPSEDYFIDIGTPQSYQQAQRDVDYLSPWRKIP
ncbi:MAG: hypothetical protein D6675_08880 [Gemmatimonadetes bacterium]|nr:MAG: hypothetical protein D6675_08880 [Gemmatimonadota bacterium]